MKRPYLFSKLRKPNGSRAVEREINLWRAVIDQALQDFLSNDKTPEAARHRQRAAVWLRGHSEDFWEVCYLAHLDPWEVQTVVAKIVGGRDKLYE